MITAFTPLDAIAGGTLIGAAAVTLMAFHGRVAGMTGILTGALLPNRGDWSWRVAFLLGAIAAPIVILMLTGNAISFAIDVPEWAIVASGLLVGVGVVYGGGCTSGHGVCGIARLSPRSILATLTFMATTFATVFVIRHVLGGF